MQNCTGVLRPADKLCGGREIRGYNRRSDEHNMTEMRAGMIASRVRLPFRNKMDADVYLRLLCRILSLGSSGM
jgi:hypothetical protein